MKNMLDYVRDTRNLALDVKPFCAADSIVLSQLAYADFGEILGNPEKKQNRRRLAEAIPLRGIRPLTKDTFFPEKNEKLLFALLESDRFREIRATTQTNEVDPETQMQFSAITFVLPTGASYVAFRGTDASLIGWKEDFNMAFTSPIPAQEAAVKYLNKMADQLPAPLLVGGHSKGGNLAVYASTRCTPETRKKLRGIFNHDGPGFRENLMEEAGFLSVAGMLQTTLPKDSIIGLLLQHDMRYRVVECRSIGLLQHDLFTWGIEDGDLYYAAQMSPSAAMFGKTLEAWLSNVEADERERFIEVLFSVINAAELSSLSDLNRGWRKAVREATKAAKALDEETRTFVLEIFGMLADAVKEQIKKEVKQTLDSFTPSSADDS